MEGGDKVFRQAVLDRLASPDQLNSLMQVTNAQGWLALLGCAILLATAVVWGFLGRVPTKVEASGILLYSGGLADVVALGQGQISALEVDVGDVVTTGQVIAEVAQPELAEQIKAAKAHVAELKANWERAKAQGGRDVNPVGVCRRFGRIGDAVAENFRDVIDSLCHFGGAQDEIVF